MVLRQRIRHGIAVTGFVLAASIGDPIAEPRLGFTSTFAQQKKPEYDPATNPLRAGPGIKALAKKAKTSDSDLGDAKRLFDLLKVGNPGGLKVTDSGDVPTVAEETLKKGGDCSGIANVVMAALNEMKIKSGIIILDLGKGLLHVLAYAEIDGKKYLMDPQLDSFGKGGAQLSSGKMLTFTHEDAKQGRKVKLLREAAFEKARGSYHFEWGSYFEGKGEYLESIKAFKNALKLDPLDSIAQRKLKAVTSGLFNKLMRSASQAINAQEWKKALEHNEQALQIIPENLGEKGKAQLRGNIEFCREKLAQEKR